MGGAIVPQYLDSNGNPIPAPTAAPAAKTYLDPNTGEPIKADDPNDTRNSIQKSFDENTKTSPNEPLLETGLKSVVGAVGAPFVHPLDTLNSLGNLINPDVDKNPLVQAVQGVQNDYKAGGAGYAATKLAGQAVGSTALGEAAGSGASAIAPRIIPAAGRAALLGKTPAEAYESALKPSTTLSQGQRAAIVQTGLDNAVPVSKAGVEKIGDLIDNYNQQIKAQIAADPTRPIDPNAVATRADVARARFANQVNSHPDLNAIEATRQQFLSEQGAKPGAPATPPKPTGILDAQGNPIMSGGTPAQPATPAPPMNAADAQAMKQGTYRVLSGKFGEQGSASVEAQKSLARGLKEEIANQFPEINDLNASESRLLDLQPVLERAVNRISNHQAIGIGTPIAASASTAISGSSGVGAVAGVLKGALDNPMVKSRLAIAISRASKIPIGQAMSRVQSYSSSLGVAAGAAASASQTTDDQTAYQK